MSTHVRRRVWGIIGLVLLVGSAVEAGAVEAGAAEPLVLGPLQLTAPADWAAKQPASSIIAYEFAVPAAEGDEQPGRMTVTAAGGSVEANIERWFGQFSQPDGSKTADRSKVEKTSVAGVETHLVDIPGTYQDRPSPRAPAVARDNYRMLGAIYVTDQGTFFVKFYGPQKTVAAQEKAFRAMVTGAKKK